MLTSAIHTAPAAAKPLYSVNVVIGNLQKTGPTLKLHAYCKHSSTANGGKLQVVVAPADRHQQLGCIHKLGLVTTQVQFRHKVPGLSGSSSQPNGVHAITLRGSLCQCDDSRALFATKASAVRHPQCSKRVSEVAPTLGVERQSWVSPGLCAVCWSMSCRAGPPIGYTIPYVLVTPYATSFTPHQLPFNLVENGGQVKVLERTHVSVDTFRHALWLMTAGLRVASQWSCPRFVNGASPGSVLSRGE
jgi:hypothetical protein